jgi:protein-S-isoprenylcysteine O-methyltransferase Ste14
MNDRLIYLAHGLLWLPFLLRPLLLKRGGMTAPQVARPLAARGATALVAVHSLGFGAVYFGVAEAVIPGRVPQLFPFQRLVALALFAAAGALTAWALAVFRSWKLRASLEVGHELVRSGPFALVRHPIYLAMNLFGLGNACWVPTPVVAAGAVLIVLGSDLRARAEERLLLQSFGETYAAYARAVKRFVPGVY